MNTFPKSSMSFKRIPGQQISVTLEVLVRSAVGDVFDFVVAEDVLPTILTGYGLLPAVVSTSANSGPWSEPGSQRTVHLADGNTALEEVTAFDRPGYFAYRTSQFTFALKYLAAAATGQWWFEPQGESTQVRWTYTFQARSALAAFALNLFARLLWAGYMRACIRNVQRHFAQTSLRRRFRSEARLARRVPATQHLSGRS